LTAKKVTLTPIAFPLGEHTQRILGVFGYSSADIAALRQAGVV
jgi:crotonobetainyl-CoA:carnitine CoA-transferase CaiB-like acyl-CoA transferase